MTTHSTILAWRIPCIEISDGLQSMGSQRVRQKHLSWDPNFPLYYSVSFSFLVVVYLLSHVQLFAAPWTATCQASLSFTISQNLLKLMSIDSMMPSNHLFLCLSSYSLLTNVTDCLLQRFVYLLILSQLCQDDFSKTQILRYHSLATKIFGYYELTIVYW